jgi:hypothetical protein
MALMLGLIHVAPLGATPETRTVIQKQGIGFVRIHAFPWARVSIDGAEVGETPLDKAFELAEGTHVIRFEHTWYAPVERTVEVTAGGPEKPVELVVDFEADGTLLPGKTRPAEEDQP